MADNLADNSTTKRTFSEVSAESISTSPELKKHFMELSSDIPDEKASQGEWSKFLFEQLLTINKNFSALAESHEFVTKKLEDTNKEVSSVKMKLMFAETDRNRISMENDYLRKELKVQKEKIVKLETYNRRENMVFDGILESEDEDCEQKISSIIQQVREKLPELGDFQINIAHRMGPHKPTVHGKNIPRPILVHVTSYKMKSILMKHKKELPKNIFVRDDLPEEILERQRMLRPIVQKAKETGHKAGLVRDTLRVDGKSYTMVPYNTLGQLPIELNPMVISQKENSSTIAYFGALHPLSNFHPVDMRVNGRKYSCSEQALQHTKALHFKDFETAMKILDTSSPYKMKRLGLKIKGFNQSDWDNVVPAVIDNIIMEKFKQNQGLLRILLETKEKLIVEATKERPWGTGIPLHDENCLDQNAWKSTGLMSSVLMSTRYKLKDYITW